VARRYGKPNKSSEKSLLEIKREKRAAARLAAEAKQRREHPRSSPMRASPMRAAAYSSTRNYPDLSSPSSYRGSVQDYSNQTGDLTPNRRDDNVQSTLSEQFPRIDGGRMSRYVEDSLGREEQFNNDDNNQERESTQQAVMEDQPNLQHGYQNSNQNEDNMDYYSQNMETYYYDNQQQQPQQPQQQQQSPSAAEEVESIPSPTRNPPKSPRRQPTTSARIQASHAEDVLTLSLELERTRSALKAANAQLANVQSQNEDLQSQLLNNNNSTTASGDYQSTQSQIMEELRMEKIRSKAAEEDAALALELAKDAQAVKEECEEWLTRSLDEIDFWKNKCLLMEKEYGTQQRQQKEDAGDDDNENKKLVRFKEDCPPSPVVSVEGGDDGAVDETEKRPPPPPEYPFHPPSPKNAAWSTPQTTGNNRSLTFTPNSCEPTPSKSAVANGRLYLHNASPLLSPNGVLSPNPRIRASELMKRSAETRRILRERLSASGQLTGPSPPPSMAHIAAVAAKTKGNAMSNDACQQGGAVFKTIGNVLYESGHRLKLDGRKWAPTQNGSHVVIATGAALETMVKDYCGQVEVKIGQQKEKIDELTAFCDHLEVEFINSR
jgi:hypothetical protein